MFFESLQQMVKLEDKKFKEVEFGFDGFEEQILDVVDELDLEIQKR